MDAALRGVFGGIEADVQDEQGPEHRRREPAQVEARRCQERRQFGGDSRPIFPFDAHGVHARGRVKAQGSGGFEFRIALERGDEHHRFAGFLRRPPGDDEVEVRAGLPQGGQGIGQSAGFDRRSW